MSGHQSGLVVVAHLLVVAVLRLVEILPHDRIEGFAPEAKDLAEGQPEVLVGGGVDDGVEETVGVAQPEEERRQPARDDQRGRLVTHERTDQGQHEKREPAQREGAHDDPQRRRSLSHSSSNQIKIQMNNEIHSLGIVIKSWTLII